MTDYELSELLFEKRQLCNRVKQYEKMIYILHKDIDELDEKISHLQNRIIEINNKLSHE